MKTVEERILRKHDLFVQMWNSDQRTESIAALFMVSTTTVNTWGKKLGLPRRYLGAQCKPFIDDNPKDAALRFAKIAIHERKAAIQLHWDEETEYLRRVTRNNDGRVQRLTWSSGNFIDAGEPAINPVMDSKMMNKLMKESGHTRQSHSGFYRESA